MHSFFDSNEYCYRLKHIYLHHAKKGDFHITSRNYCELIYKLDGSSNQIFSDRTIRLIPDCLYIIPACYKNNEVKVDVAGSIINIIFEIIDCTFSQQLYPEIIQLGGNNSYKSLFMRLLNIWEKKDAGYIFHAQSIFSTILAHIASDRSHSYLNSDIYLRIKPAIEYINIHFMEKMSIAQLAELCEISDEYMRQLFRSFLGKNPLEYIHTKRLEAARDLLYKSDSSISDIALSCGFQDPRYFSRLYKKEFGVTPLYTRKFTIG